MYQDTIDQFAETAAKKVKMIADNPLGFFIASMMAGAYVGLGIIAIFSIGQGLDPSIRPLVMGLTFAIALTLVVFAGAEPLGTGHGASKQEAEQDAARAALQALAGEGAEPVSAKAPAKTPRPRTRRAPRTPRATAEVVQLPEPVAEPGPMAVPEPAPDPQPLPIQPRSRQFGEPL
jgi:hypothetical protein